MSSNIQFHFFYIILHFFILSDMSISQQINLEKDYNSLLAVERTFSKTAELLGTRSAFLRFLREDAVVFNPQPVSGVELWTGQPESESSLNWRPIYAQISSSGDFGFTTGPWEYKTNKNEENPVAYGHYVTIWEKNEIGLWEAAIDAGISYQSIDTTLIEDLNFVMKDSVSSKAEKYSKDVIIKSLLQKDADFSAISERDGFKNAFAETTSQNVRLYRNNYFPFIGIESSLQFLNDEILKWKPSGGGISSANDMGYTYGVGERIEETGTKNKFSYFRIWQKFVNDEWKLILDLNIPIDGE